MASIFDTNIRPQSIAMLRGAGSNSATNALRGISDLVQNRRTREDRKVIQEQALAQQALQNERQARLDALNAKNVRSSIAARAATQARADKEYNRLLKEQGSKDLAAKELLGLSTTKSVIDTPAVTPEMVEASKQANLAARSKIYQKVYEDEMKPEEDVKKKSTKAPDRYAPRTKRVEVLMPTDSGSNRASKFSRYGSRGTPSYKLEKHPWIEEPTKEKTEIKKRVLDPKIQKAHLNALKAAGLEENYSKTKDLNSKLFSEEVLKKLSDTPAIKKEKKATMKDVELTDEELKKSKIDLLKKLVAEDKISPTLALDSVVKLENKQNSLKDLLTKADINLKNAKAVEALRGKKNGETGIGYLNELTELFKEYGTPSNKEEKKMISDLKTIKTRGNYSDKKMSDAMKAAKNSYEPGWWLNDPEGYIKAVAFNLGS